MTKYFTNNFTVTNLHKKPSIKSEIVTQMIYGDAFSISKRSKKWLKIRIKEDGYYGFVKNRKFSKFSKPTHKVNVLRSKIFKFSNTRVKINEISFGSKIKVLETNRRNIMSNIKKVEELEDKYAAYQYYMDAVKRDGIPYELISKALPTVEGAVNDILAQIVDFSLILEMDGKNINCYIVYDDDNVWPLELSSGMERFISSLAMRVGLINVSNLPAPNFLAIDEGWGTMDSDNLNSVYNLFQYLKSQFQFTMIVSHIDSMRDAVDTLLEIKKEDKFSNVFFD